MPDASGVQSAIRELEQDVKKIETVIGMLKKIHAQRSTAVSGGRPRRRLSAEARRRISEAAKKRWAARRGAKGQTAKAKA